MMMFHRYVNVYQRVMGKIWDDNLLGDFPLVKLLDGFFNVIIDTVTGQKQTQFSLKAY